MVVTVLAASDGDVWEGKLVVAVWTVEVWYWATLTSVKCCAFTAWHPVVFEPLLWCLIAQWPHLRVVLSLHDALWCSNLWCEVWFDLQALGTGFCLNLVLYLFTPDTHFIYWYCHDTLLKRLLPEELTWRVNLCWVPVMRSHVSCAQIIVFRVLWMCSMFGTVDCCAMAVIDWLCPALTSIDCLPLLWMTCDRLKHVNGPSGGPSFSPFYFFAQQDYIERVFPFAKNPKQSKVSPF